MLLKNALLYRLNPQWQISLNEMQEQLRRGRYQEPSATDASSRGWVPPHENGDLVLAQGEQWLIRLKLSKKILPGSVIREAAMKQAKALERQQGFPCGRKQLRELKDRVTLELLPKSHVKHDYVCAWLDTQNGWMAIDTSSPNKADEIIEFLGQCLSEFPLQPLRTQLSPASAMANWLASGDAPDSFTVDRDCELKSRGEDKSTVAYKHHSLESQTAKEIREHMANGKMPTKLSMTWNDRLSFVLADNLSLKKLTWLEIVFSDQTPADDKEEQFNADFALITGELQRFLPALVGALGGEIPTDTAGSGSESRREPVAA